MGQVMSDPIITVLKQACFSSGYEFEFDDMATEIRQYIGRELLDPNKTTYGYTTEMIERIREVCKLTDTSQAD